MITQSYSNAGLLWSHGGHCITVQPAYGCTTSGLPDHARLRRVMVKDLTMVDLIKWYIRWKSLTAVSASAMEKVEPLARRGRTELHGVS